MTPNTFDKQGVTTLKDVTGWNAGVGGDVLDLTVRTNVGSGEVDDANAGGEDVDMSVADKYYTTSNIRSRSLGKLILSCQYIILFFS